MKKGELTAFLSLTFVLLLSFILGILEISVVHTTKNLSRLEADRAVFSLFGEYHKKLLEDYHVFSVEGSYGTGNYDEENLTGRMHYYGNGQTGYEITGIQYLTDNRGQAFKEQVIKYMEQRYGISIIKDFSGMTDQWEDQSIQGEEMEDYEADILEEIDQIKNAGSEAVEGEGGEEGQPNLEEAQNPFSCMEKIEKSGVLSVVLPKDMELSGKQITPGNQVSNRAIRSGRGSFPARTNINGAEEKLLFNEYIMKNFSNAAMDKESGEDSKTGETESGSGTDTGRKSLDYEVEYIIAGKNSDKENLESVLTKLFFIRTAINYAGLMGDSARQSEAAGLAAVISVILLIPEASEMIKQMILFAWASGESVIDIRTLLSGRRAPLVKTSENWQLPLSGLLTLGIGTEQRIGEDDPEGISYETYLRGFLFLESQDRTAVRTLDRIEENIKTLYGMEYFKADQCITKIEIKSTANIFGNITYEFPVYFGYQ